MKNKLSLFIVCLAVTLFCSFSSSAEAKHCRKNHFSFNIGAFLPAPAVTYVQQPVVVEQYYPYYGQPVYAAPRPVVRPVYVCPGPCYQPVVVAARPCYGSGFSFSWYR